MGKDDGGSAFRQAYNNSKPGSQRPGGLGWPDFDGISGPAPEVVSTADVTRNSTADEVGLKEKPRAAEHSGMADLNNAADSVTSQLNMRRGLYPGDSGKR